MNKIGVFCASSNNMDAVYYEAAAELGAYIGKQNKTLVYGGHASGLMEAVAKATSENGGNVMGIIPRLLYERGTVSKYVNIEIPCQDLNDRKQLLAEKSDILIALPGSVGTLDEAFTVIASNTIGLSYKHLVFWNINGFWDELVTLFSSLKAKGVMTKDFSKVFTIANTLEEVIDIIDVLGTHTRK